MGATKEIAGFCHKLGYQGLSPEVVDRVRYLALDFLGVAARGSLERSSRVVRSFITDVDNAAGGCVVIGSDLRASAHYAALANGAAAHSLELDDVSNESSSHPGVAIFPAALAAAELAGCDGRKLIEAVVVGYEVMIRLGKALNPASHYARGFHPTGTCGAFGAAAAAAKILGLSQGEIINALGIAGSQAAGSMEFLTDGSWVKRLHPGWAAQSGIIAALLARRGFTGPTTILEGGYGFLHAYSDSPDPGKLVAGLGDSFEVMRVSIKPHACCRYKQGPIDGILKIMREDNLGAQDVAEVKLGILKAGFPIVVEPREVKYSPRTVVDAQFSMPFGAALAILYGRASLDEYTEANLRSPEVGEMMNRISCISDAGLDNVYPRKWPASVEIVTKDGKKFSTRVDYPRGDPENPLSWEEVIQKFEGLAAPVFSGEDRAEIISRVRSLETEPDLAALGSLLSVS
ncbi:MAG TPA: MmgE/PrpD family protein [Dehalococcoidia bacterium]|nr:MmgE/PrpD family protein [Dehalococcoidia bacterium]